MTVDPHSEAMRVVKEKFNHWREKKSNFFLESVRVIVSVMILNKIKMSSVLCESDGK